MTDPVAIRVLVGDGEPEIKVIRVLVPGEQGPAAPNPRLKISETEPEDLEEGEVWLDISR